MSFRSPGVGGDWNERDGSQITRARSTGLLRRWVNRRKRVFSDRERDRFKSGYYHMFDKGGRGISKVSDSSFRNNRELFYDKMAVEMDWILGKLGLSTPQSIFRFNTGFAFNVECVKAAIIKDRTNVQTLFGNDKWICKDEDIYDIRIKNTPEDHYVYTGGSSYSLSVDSHGSISCFRIKGLNFPIICGDKTVVDPDGGSISITELWMAMDNAEKFFDFLKDQRNKSELLFVTNYSGNNKTINPMKWEDVILNEEAKTMIIKDISMFMNNRKWFEENKLPYRRGYLLHGPPGNGKTTVIRALLTQCRIPAYMLSNYSERDSARNFEQMFGDAANNERSMILLEDIDRIFCATGEDKDSDSNTISFSSFLNCLDGVSTMDGVVVVATANNPKVLDAAILERPGRFDRVVGFPNPTKDLAIEYFMKLKPAFDFDGIKEIIDSCKDMSFAQLKETYILAHQISLELGRDVIEEDLATAAKKLKQAIKQVASSSSVGFN